MVQPLISDPSRSFQLPQQNLAATMIQGGQLRQNQDVLQANKAKVQNEALRYDREYVQKERQAAVVRLKTIQSLLGSVRPNDSASYERSLGNIQRLFGPEMVGEIRKNFPAGTMNEDDIEQSKQMLRGMANQIGVPMKPGEGQKILGPEAKLVGPGGEEIARGIGKAEPAPRALKVWVTPEGDPITLPNNVQPPEGSVPYSSGMDIEVTPEGTTIRTGVGRAGGDVTRKTEGAIESKIIGGREQLARMQIIIDEFKPEYQEIGNRLAKTWTSIKAKFGRDVSPEDAAALTEFKKFQRKAIENINLYIKELTGAQMSEKEADRLRLAQPDPGENWWKGDDPITFKAKADDVMKYARAAVARYEYYRAKGLTHETIKNKIASGDIDINLDDLVKKMN